MPDPARHAYLLASTRISFSIVFSNFQKVRLNKYSPRTKKIRPEGRF